MDGQEQAKTLRGSKKLVAAALFCVICVAANYICAQIPGELGLPFYFDCLGTILAGVFGGFIPGIIVGYVTNLITSLSDPVSVYWCFSSVLIALFAALFAKKGWFDKPHTIVLAILAFAFAGGGVGSVITWCLNGAFGGGELTGFAQQVSSATGLTGFAAQLCADFLVDVADKGITVIVAVVIIHVLPSWLKNLFDFSIWQQEPLEGEQLAAVRRTQTRGISLRSKTVALIAIVMVLAGIVTTSISFIMYQRANAEAQATIGEGIANLAAERINPDRVNEYIKLGESVPGYEQTERGLEEIRQQFVDVEYIYVYQIREDGCHVVFDLDTEGVPGASPGDVIAFDESFLPYLSDLLAGKPIEPLESNDSYGWLLTVYHPLYNSAGECVAYVGVDISMERLLEDGFAFLARIAILFVAFLTLVCVIAIWLAEYGVVMPVNSIAMATGGFAFDNKSTRDDSVEQLRRLNIRTGDEVENLYHAIVKTSEDTVQFIADGMEKAATIERMQNNLIMVMADLVESRDKYTGDHVRKTAAYTRAIMEQMRREGIYADVLTDEFVENVVKSAPLHDIGKIMVSDTILNKPGRLTDDEFALMQRHTLAGKEILEDAVGAMSDPGYLDEACRLAAFHHEKWNGKGYPYGLAGEDIPLSARIMAVADVFDALVSKRSYKEGMPIEKALQIIREESGEHFDPEVARAFLDAEGEVRRIAEEHGDASGTAADIREQMPPAPAPAQ